jgi:fatty acid desaturase
LSAPGTTPRWQAFFSYMIGYAWICNLCAFWSGVHVVMSIIIEQTRDNFFFHDHFFGSGYAQFFAHFDPGWEEPKMAPETGKVTTFKVFLPDFSVPDLWHFGSDSDADPGPYQNL